MHPASMTDSQLIKGTSGISTECLPQTTTTDDHLMEVVDEPGKFIYFIVDTWK